MIFSCLQGGTTDSNSKLSEFVYQESMRYLNEEQGVLKTFDYQLLMKLDARYQTVDTTTQNLNWVISNWTGLKVYKPTYTELEIENAKLNKRVDELKNPSLSELKML